MNEHLHLHLQTRNKDITQLGQFVGNSLAIRWQFVGNSLAIQWHVATIYLVCLAMFTFYTPPIIISSRA